MTITLAPEIACHLPKSLPQGDPDRLAEIQQSICDHTEKERACTRQALFHAKEIGKELEKAKPMISHGHWESWINDHCPFSPRTARNYIFIAQNWNELSEIVADLSAVTMTEALKLLKNPKKKEKEAEVYAAPLTELLEFRQFISQKAKRFKNIKSWSKTPQGQREKLLDELLKAINQIHELIAHIDAH